MDTITTDTAGQTAVDPLAESFDLANRLDATDANVTVLRSDVDEVKARLDKVGRAAIRPALEGASQATQSPEVKSFINYLRTGIPPEQKSVSGTVLSDGGYAVPRPIDDRLAETLLKISPIRAISQVVQVGSAGYRKLITTGGTPSGWVSENAARPITSTPTFVEIVPPSGELYANPAASQAMLDDAAFDLEPWLASEIGMEFARAEGAAFVNGTGTNLPLLPAGMPFTKTS